MRLYRFLPAAVLLSLPLVLHAQSGLQNCAAIEDSAARLACYDAAVGAPAADDAPRPPREAVEPAAPPPELPAPRNAGTPDGARAPAGAVQPPDAAAGEFGLEREAQEEIPDTLRLRVAAARHSDISGWTIEFENGQVWRQVGSDRFTIEVGQRYLIRRASFDSHLLGTETGNRTIRVTRIR